MREFVLGNNQTGLVTSSGNSVSVVGGEDPALAGEVLKDAPEIYMGSFVTTSTYLFPTATVSQWDAYLAEVTGIVSSDNIPTSGAETNGRMGGWALAGVMFIGWTLSL